jgi:hypothetical protein
MSSIKFPPHNPDAYNVPQDLFKEPLRTSAEKAGLGDTSQILRSPDNGVVAKGDGTNGDYLNLWNHFVSNYWAEIYDVNLLKKRGGSPTNANSALTTVREVFKEHLYEFESGSNGYLKSTKGVNATDFYKSTNGVPAYSDSEKTEFWEQFLRLKDVGRKRWNVILWVWGFLIKMLKTMQLSTLNKALAQRWMNDAQKVAVSDMDKVQFNQQRSAEDFEYMHKNQLASHGLDIIRGERGNVQRLSSAKATDTSATQQKAQEANTFLTSLIDTLQNVLRGVIK